MSQENVEMVKRVQPSGVDLVPLFRTSTPPDPAATGIDVTAFASDFETEFIARRTFGSIRPRTFHGLQGFGESWRDWLEPWESYYIEAEEFIDAGDDVVVLLHEHRRGRGSGVELEAKTAVVVAVSGGRVVRIQGYMDRAAALEAAGLSE